MEQLGDVGEGVEMFLKLALGNQKQHDEFDRLVIKRVEVDALFRAAERADDLVNQIR